MNRESILSGNSRQYISVSDCDMLAQIAKLLPFYKSFNRLANDALAYGLPKLIDEKLGNSLNDESNKQSSERTIVQVIESTPDERIDLIIRLLQELTMNTTISKSLICSLFNAKNSELNDRAISGQKFDSGAMRYTPSCMMKYEVDMLNKMDDEDD